MCPGKRPAAKVRIGVERLAFDDLADRTETAILELTNVKLPVGFWVFGKAQKNVARRLHRALPLDDAAALMDQARRRRGDLCENRRQRLLDLQKQRLSIRRHKKPDRAKRTNAADADDLEGDVGKRVALHQRAPFRKEGGLVVGERGKRISL